MPRSPSVALRCSANAARSGSRREVTCARQAWSGCRTSPAANARAISPSGLRWGTGKDVDDIAHLRDLATVLGRVDVTPLTAAGLCPDGAGSSTLCPYLTPLTFSSRDLGKQSVRTDKSRPAGRLSFVCSRWRCRESNPGPPACWQDFSERSSLCLSRPHQSRE